MRGWGGSIRFALASVGLLAVSSWAVAQDPPSETELAIRPVYEWVLGAVRTEAIKRNFQDITRIGPRVAGTEGERKALEYAERRLRDLGLTNIRRESFEVTVPDPEATGSLRVGGRSVEVYPLWPNLVQTSTCDVEGPLIYGGDGSLEAFRGLSVDGAIVVMEFDSGARWRNAAKLGAKAVIFLEPRTVTRADAEQKFSNVPLNIPRFYLPLERAGAILTAAYRGEWANLNCRQDWVKRESYNLLADLPGTDSASEHERVLLFGYADSMSVVPKLAYGASSATGLAALLELVEQLKNTERRRPLTVCVSGAHFLAMQGAREFVEKRFETDRQPYLVGFTLDLSGGSPTIGNYAQGWFYEYRDELMFQVRPFSRLLREHADRMAKVFGVPHARQLMLDAMNNSDDRPWRNNIPGKFAFDCEPFLLAQYQVMTLATVNDGRALVDTPFDTADRVDLANVAIQTRTILGILHHALNDSSRKGALTDFRVPMSPQGPTRMGVVGGFAKLTGRVVVFDPNVSFVPDVPVPGAVATLGNRQKTLMGVRGDMMDRVGENAEYRFVGAAPISSYWVWNMRMTSLDAFRLNPETGRIDHAPSLGLIGETDSLFELKTAYKSTPIVVFPCTAVDLYDLVDPQDLRALQYSTILDAETDATPRYFGFYQSWVDTRLTSEVEDTAVLFMEPAKRFKVLMGSLGEYRLILTNSFAAAPFGIGYLAPGPSGEALMNADDRSLITTGGRMPLLPLQTARDIHAINQHRLDQFAKYRMISPGISALQGQAEAELQDAAAAQEAKDWPALERHARAAWGLALRAHPIIQKTANDVVNGVVFYLFLLVPFSYFMERLLFACRSLTAQLGYAGGIFIGSFLLLRLIHPAFEIVSNPFMIFVGFVMGALSVIVISFILSKFETSLKTLKAAQSGVHEVDIRRLSVALAAFNLGVSNMRRRKARTILTTLTLVVMTFIVLSFTSIVSDIRFAEAKSDDDARYPGLMIRNPGLDPMQNNTYRLMANEFADRAAVSRRAWYYGADIRDVGTQTLSRADRAVDARVMLGLDPEEAGVTRPQEGLLPGSRWFKPGDRDVMILPEPMAEQLKIKADDVGRAYVNFAGKPYQVIGLIDAGFLRGLTDLDGDSILPADFSLSRQQQTESRTSADAFRKYIRIDPGQVFLVPAQTALDLGADVRSIAVGFEKPEDTRERLEAMMPRLRMNIYAGVQDGDAIKIRQFSAMQSQQGRGLALVLIQMAIAAIFVLNTMIASVYERTKEISIFSAIGLAPNHIAMLFFAESLVYGILGAVIGYFISQAIAKVIIVTNSLQGLYLNFSSTSAVLSAAIVMAVVLLSTIYPARRASQIAAPALEEDLTEVEPDSNDWTIPLPFSVSSDEAPALIEYLGEWFAAYEEYTVGDFVTSASSLSVTPGEFGTDYCAETTAWLAPYDLGVCQRVRLVASASKLEGVHDLTLHLTRTNGDPENWITTNKRFLANLRKQFLTWRTLDRDQQERFHERARERANPRDPVLT